ncbi:MAG: PilT/PilU family type 4a pilus ATPase, partial [Planctomycetaceae bacterium]
NLEPLTPKSVEAICDQLMSTDQQHTLEQHQDVDFSVSIPRLGRFRVNVHRQKSSFATAIRHIASQIPTLEQMEMPQTLVDLTRLKSGLVLVTGQTGSGKSTTLAAMIDEINRRDAKHIITLEDPIEFQFTHKMSLIEQREIGTDCPSFASGLKHILRQDPDVILVGELRELETIRTAMQAAETGHLVFATLHSSSTWGAAERIVEVFPANEQMQIRAHLSDALKAVVTQRLLPSADGRGRVAAQEILIVNRAIQTNLREGNSHLIPGLMDIGRRTGMLTMDQAVRELALNGRISTETAEEHLANPTADAMTV